MCFINDYDWIARVVEHFSHDGQKKEVCDECCCTIEPGLMRHETHMEEYEECQACYEGDCECPEGKCCACLNPTFGESFDYVRCDACEKFLKAVDIQEADDGCAPSESRPALGEMVNSIQDLGAERAKEYFQRALKDSPEIKVYLGRLWNRMFV